MMRTVTVISSSEVGRLAIEKHVGECLKAKFGQKLMMKQLGIQQTVTVQDPMTLELFFKNKRLASVMKPEHVVNEVKAAMLLNGATEGIDYKIEVD